MAIKKDDIRILKKLLKLLAPFKGKIIVIIICMILSSAINMFLPYVSKQIMDDGLIQKNFIVIVQLSLVLLFLAILDQAIGIFETKYYAYLNALFQYNLFKISFKKTLKLKIQYFNNTNFAEIISNVGMDIGNITRVSDRSMFFILMQIFRIIGGMIGLLFISWKLTLAVLLIFPIRYFIVKYLAKKRKEAFEKLMEYNADFSLWYGDTLSGVKEVKLWGIDRIKMGQFIKKQRKLILINIKMAFLDKLNECSETTLFQIINSIIYILGAYWVVGDRLSVGGLFAFLSYSAFVTAPISAILNIGYSFSNVIPSAKRFFEFLDIESEINKSDKKLKNLTVDDVKGDLIFEKVCFSYKDDKETLKNISFELRQGEKLAIIGDNGSGKSTLINLILRLYTPDSGQIFLDKMDINDIKLRDYRSLISAVSQEIYLFIGSIKDNILLGCKKDEIEIHRAAKNSGASSFLEKLPQKYDTLVGRNGLNLSGGERQKIAMARAFARKSRILVMDEATSNYDVESEIYVNDIIKSLNKEMTVIIVSHKSDILKKVDRVIMLENGSIVDTGSHSELYMKNLKYRQIVDKNEVGGSKKSSKSF